MALSTPCRILDGVTASVRTVERLLQARALMASGEARRIREAAGLSLASVAPVVGADPSAIGRWERGQRIPGGRAALKYAQLIIQIRARLEAANEEALWPPAA
jgi:DNA-binding transcriptional regulator YiaG